MAPSPPNSYIAKPLDSSAPKDLLCNSYDNPNSNIIPPQRTSCEGYKAQSACALRFLDITDPVYFASLKELVLEIRVAHHWIDLRLNTSELDEPLELEPDAVSGGISDFLNTLR